MFRTLCLRIPHFTHVQTLLLILNAKMIELNMILYTKITCRSWRMSFSCCCVLGFFHCNYFYYFSYLIVIILLLLLLLFLLLLLYVIVIVIIKRYNFYHVCGLLYWINWKKCTSLILGFHTSSEMLLEKFDEPSRKKSL